MKNESVYAADLLVIGSGMAGMTAAFAAAGRGAKVVVVEKAPEIGGSAAISGAHLWTARSYDQLRAECPDGDAELQRAFLDGFPVAMEFVRQTGVEFSEELDVLYGSGRRFDILTYFRKAKPAIEAAGGHVAVSTQVDWLLTEESRVVGARVRDADGPVEIEAPWVLLATGGFQGNRSLLRTYMGDRADRVLLRSNPHSVGDGLRLGQAAGAAISGNMATFYGHLLASPLPEVTVREFVRFALLYSTEGVLLNVDGARFAKEWLGDHLNAQRVAEQRQGRAVIVIDDRVRRGPATAPIVRGLEAIDTVEDARSVGARVASSDSVAGLADAISAWGYAGGGLAAAVEEHAHALAGSGRGGSPLTTPPYFAVEVRPGITFTQGGLRIDRSSRVLDAEGQPIPGLLAAGADSGGVFNGGYAGGLALASVLGLKAAELCTNSLRAAS